MLPSSYYPSILHPTNLKLGPFIGSGQSGDGKVWQIQDTSDRVIKLSPLSSDQEMHRLLCILDVLKKQRPPAYAHIYEYGYLTDQSQLDIQRLEQASLVPQCQIFVIMERLLPLTLDEQKVMHTLLSHEDSNKNKRFSSDQIQKMLEGLSRGLDFSTPMVSLLYENLQTAPIIQTDLHPRNIMKNQYNEFKIIDFDRCIKRN